MKYKYATWTAIIIGLFTGLLAALVIRFINPSEICVGRTGQNLMEGGATCSEYSTVFIVRGTEDFTMLYDSKCAKYFAKPAYDRVGGIIGHKFVGCAIFQ